MSRRHAIAASLLAIPALHGCGGTPTAETIPAGPTAGLAEEIPDRHDRPIVEERGRTLLWARETEAGDTEWFDMTGAAIDPQRFQFGIGKDTIASVDEPRFAPYGDPLLAQRGVDRRTPVLGVFIDGVARAYPVSVMSMHEVVNDEIAGKPYAVMW